MRKRSKHFCWYHDLVLFRNHCNLVKKARRNNKITFLRKRYEARNSDLLEALWERKKVKHQLYNKTYNKGTSVVNISGDFGFEDRSKIEESLKIASSIIDFDKKQLILNIMDCTRIWPSAITLLCSLVHWAELTGSTDSEVKIGSTDSLDNRVNSYLKHCGFYSYVNRKNTEVIDVGYYKDAEIVKIQRQSNQNNAEQREQEIITLLRNFSIFDENELTIFDSIILTEILNNVSEHGIVSGNEKKWWIIAQYHKTHKIISVCIADNGIGFRNNLMTGMQRDEISEILENAKQNDGEFIKLGLNERDDKLYSGAITLPPRHSGFLKRKPEPGSRRGLGLKWINNACKRLKISYSILSHYGYLFIDENGKQYACGTVEKRVFAGTMFNFIIKAKEL